MTGKGCRAHFLMMYFLLCAGGVSVGQQAASSRANGQAAANQTANRNDSPQLVIDPQGFVSPVSGLDFSRPDGRFIAAAGEYEVRIWDVSSGRLVRTLRGDRGASGYGRCSAVAFSPNGNELLVAINPAGSGAAIRVYDTNNYSEIKELFGPNQPVHSLRFSRDGRYLAYATLDGRITVMDWSRRTVISEFSTSSGDSDKPVVLRDFAFPLDNSDTVMTVDSDSAKVYDTRSGKVLGPADVRSPMLLEWLRKFHSEHSRGGYLFSTDRLGNRLWPNNFVFRLEDALWLSAETETKPNGQSEFFIALRNVNDTSSRVKYSGHFRDVSAIAIGPIGDIAASADDQGEVHIWRVATGQQIYRLRASGQPVYNANLSTDLDSWHLRFGSRPFGPDRWGRNSYGADHRYFSVQNRYISGLSSQSRTSLDRTERRSEQSSEFAVDMTRRQDSGFTIRVRRDSRDIGQYRLAAGRRLTCYQFPNQSFPGVAQPLFLGDDTGALALVDTKADRINRVFVGHTAMITRIQLLEEQKIMVTASTDRTIRVWSLRHLPPVGDLDLRLETYSVLEIPAGNSAARAAGVHKGDEVVTIAGYTLEEIHRLKVLNQYPYKPGDRVTVEMKRPSTDRRYSYESTLVAGANWVEPLLTFFIDGDDWIAWTPEGYFDAAPGADGYIGWLVNQGHDKNGLYYPASRFRDSLYRPDIIREVWNTADVAAAVERANSVLSRQPAKINLRNPEIFNRLRPPEVSILSPSDRTRVGSEPLEVTLQINNFDAPARKVTLLLNGQPVETRSLQTSSVSEVLVSFSVDIPAGEHRLGAIVDSGRSQEFASEVDIARSQGAATNTQRPNLHAIIIGVSEHQNPEYNLRFAHRDAQVFSKALEKHAQGRLYDQVNIRLLDGHQGPKATRQAIQDAMTEIQREIRHGDSFVFFASCHGFFDGDREFYLGTYEVDESRLRSSALRWGEITDWLESLPRSTRLFFLDACESGGAVSAFDPLWRLSSPQLGVVLFSSSTSMQKSEEPPALGHGTFTFTLLSTIAGREIAGINSDMRGTGLLGVNELKYLVAEGVKNISNGKQVPVIYKSQDMGNIPEVFEILRTLEQFLRVN